MITIEPQNVLKIEFINEKEIKIIIDKNKLSNEIEQYIKNNQQCANIEQFQDIINNLRERVSQNDITKKYIFSILIVNQAFYNYWAHNFEVNDNEEIQTVLRQRDDPQNNDKIIAYFKFQISNLIPPLNYHSNVDKKTNNYLECSNSSKLIIRKEKEKQQLIQIPIQVKVPTGSYQNQIFRIKLPTRYIENLQINIAWEMINNNHLKLNLDFPNGINQVKIQSTLYSRIVIEYSNVAASPHKFLKQLERNIENTQYNQIYDFEFENKVFPPIYVGKYVNSNHIVLIKLKFQQEEIQFEIPVDLNSSDPQAEEDENQINNIEQENKQKFNKVDIYKNYFYSISLIKGAYKDHQTYI